MSYTINGGYVSEIQRTGAPIWEDLYTVRIPYKHTVSIDHLREIGLPSAGHRMLDQVVHNEIVTIMITIDAIVEYYRVGIRVRLPVASELDAMYNTVNLYLLAWKKQLEHGINIGDAPVEDLLLLDRFASELYDQSRLVNGDKVSPLADISKLLGGSRVIGRDMLFKSLDSSSGTNAPEEADKHYSMASIFSSKVFSTAPVEGTEPRKSSRWK